MERLSGTLKRYAWGTTDAIPDLLGIAADGGPYAEYWLGAHESSPSTLGDRTLVEHLHRGPSLLGHQSREAFGEQLPYLMKVLSAAQPLSLQAHPSRDQAEEGWARENRAGIALDSPERTYKDSWPKPELMIALDQFHSLSGFRDPHETAALFAGLGVSEQLASVIAPLTERKGEAGLAEVFLDVLSLGDGRAHLVNEVVVAAMKHRWDDGEVGEFARTTLELDATFPSDQGILAGLLLNRVVLRPGEAMFVKAGQMHAHLRGTGIEVMANSDNVIRGGLTPKHIDVEELIRVVGFSPLQPEVMAPLNTRPGVWKYQTPCSEFEAWSVRLTPELGPVLAPGNGAARILLVVEGTITLRDGRDQLRLRRGESAFLSGLEDEVHLEGQGVAFGASSGLR